MLNCGTAEQAIKFALSIDDHFDMRAFLEEWQKGSLDPDEWEDYFASISN